MGRRSRISQGAISLESLTDSLPLSFIDADVLGVEDRRLFDPEAVRPARGVTISSAKVVERSSDSRVGGFSFGDPSLVAICARRARRREVLHALRRTGRGGGRKRRPRRNLYSSISCR